MCRQRGLSDESLQSLDRFVASDAFSDVEKLALHYAHGMTQTPVQVTDELFHALQGHFSERQLVELTSCIAWENYRARFDHAFGIGAESFSGDEPQKTR